jgi:hypothetical protein
VTEVKVVAHIDFQRSNSREQDLAYELFRANRCELCIEIFHDQSVDLSLLEQLDLLFVGREQTRSSIGPQYPDGMRIEGIDDGGAFTGSRSRHDGVRDRAMTNMQPIEIANRDDGFLQKAAE